MRLLSGVFYVLCFPLIPTRPLPGEGDPMPLSINVGLSRKASRDYQSTGVSINVTAELDQALAGQARRTSKAGRRSVRPGPGRT